MYKYKEVSMTKKRFNAGQCWADVVRALIACALVASGHPYFGVLAAMIYIEV